jgi:hypothetical protein
MYSYEIEKLLELRKHLISVQEYLEIIKSPQIDHIKYENDTFFLWSSDGYSFKLKIKKEG